MTTFRTHLLLAGCLSALTACGPEFASGNGAGADGTAYVAEWEAAENQLRTSTKYDGFFAEAEENHGVPGAVLKALAWNQSRLEMMHGEVEFEGVSAAIGVMGLTDATLPRAAELAGVSLESAGQDVRSNILAAAALMSAQAQEKGLTPRYALDWAPVLEEWSGTPDAHGRERFVAAISESLRRGVGPLSEALALQGDNLEGSEAFSQVALALDPAPDFPGGVWRPSPNTGSRGSHRVRMVIIHSCEGGYSGCVNTLASPASGVSAHYTVNESGSQVTQLVREGTRGFHIGATYNASLNAGAEGQLNGVQSNYFTVGIEHAGFASQPSWSAGLIGISSKLVCSITSRHGVPRDRQHIVSHGQLQPYNRTDPGRNWPWAQYINQINAECGGGGTTLPVPPTIPDAPAEVAGSVAVDSDNAMNATGKSEVRAKESWTRASSTAGFYGNDYLFAEAATLSDGVEFWFYLDAPAKKTVDGWWTVGGNRTNDATFIAFDANGNRVGSVSGVDQSNSGSKWMQLGQWEFTAGWNRVVLSRWAPGGKVILADAIRVR